jgi:RNA polymerase sigma-70 factor (ECF subfamily)
VAVLFHNPMDKYDVDDDEIIKRVLDGEVNVYELLVNKYQSIVLSILKKRLPFEQVEEVAQLVFIKGYQSLPSYNAEGPVKNWLSSIAVKACYDFWRTSYKNKEVSVYSLSLEDKEWFDKALLEQSTQVLIKKGQESEAKELLNWALGKLSPEDKAVLELVYLEGLSHKEASELLGWSVANIKVRSFRSRRKLAEILKRLTL